MYIVHYAYIPTIRIWSTGDDIILYTDRDLVFLEGEKKN